VILCRHVRELAEILSSLTSPRVFLVCGKTSFTSSGADLKLLPLLKGLEVTRFTDFTSNPNFEDAIKGAESFLASKSNLILVIGGGSAIDIAKLIKVFSGIDRASIDLVGGVDPSPDCKVPIIAIPTTSGTGSEATHFAVIYKDKVKFSVAHPSLVPEFVILDPELTRSMSPYLAASSGLDALSQAMEAHWSVNSTLESRQCSIRALEIAWAWLFEAVTNNGAEARKEMMEASFLAGKAINIAKTTAPHALSYSLTAHFGISHGQAVGFFLPSFLSFNDNICSEDCIDPRGSSFVSDRLEEIYRVIGVKDGEEAEKILSGFILSLNLHTHFNDAGLDRSVVPIILNGVNEQRLKNNPRSIDSSQLSRLISNLVEH